jgi:hypothetical protein
MEKRIDLDALSSDKKGIKGFFELMLRRFKVLAHLLTMIPFYAAACLIIAISAWPGVMAFNFITSLAEPGNLKIFLIGFGLAFGYFCYGVTSLFVVSLFNFILRANLKPWRGPYYSFEAFMWYLHNGLTYLPRFTFLDFVTPTPLGLLFYKMMGMKIGSGTIINTTFISDPSLITIGKKVTVGGSVTIVGHYGQGGLLVLAPVVIGDNCTLGLKCSIMGDVIIGNNVKIMPHSAVMPKTVIPDNETWGGVPAHKIEKLEVPLKKIS